MQVSNLLLASQERNFEFPRRLNSDARTLQSTDGSAQRPLILCLQERGAETLDNLGLVAAQRLISQRALDIKRNVYMRCLLAWNRVT